MTLSNQLSPPFSVTHFPGGTITLGPDNLGKLNRFTTASSDGFPPSPAPVVVETDGRDDNAVISGTQARMAPGDPGGHRFRIRWNK